LSSWPVTGGNHRGDKLVLDAVAGVWNNKKVKVSKGEAVTKSGRPRKVCIF
jgi:hypothetical protein